MTPARSDDHAHGPPRPPLCPRCDYDLCGQVATWGDAWPLAGRCNECGLDFRWSAVLGRIARVDWLFELSGGRGKTWRRWRTTVARSLQPRRFWGTVDLATPMRTGRLVLFGLLWLVLMHLGCALAALLVYWEQAGWPTLGRLRNPAYTRYEAPLVARIILYPSGGRRGVMGMGFPLWDMVFAGFVVMALTPVVFMVLGETLSRARVRRRHILRGLCYAPPWLSLAAAPLVVVLIVGYVDLLFSLRLGRITGSVMQLVVPASLGLAAAGHIWWWRCFARGYLRINHTWPVAVLAVLVACLATPVLCWVLPEAIGLRIGW